MEPASTLRLYASNCWRYVSDPLARRSCMVRAAPPTGPSLPVGSPSLPVACAETCRKAPYARALARSDMLSGIGEVTVTFSRIMTCQVET